MTELSITLTSDEALVLYDLLQRYEKSDILSITDQAEQRALWNLLCVLDKELLEPLQENYQDAVRQARDRLRDEDPDG